MNLKICDGITDITACQELHFFACFFQILSNIKMKLRQTLVQFMGNICENWKLIAPGPFVI